LKTAADAPASQKQSCSRLFQLNPNLIGLGSLEKGMFVFALTMVQRPQQRQTAGFLAAFCTYAFSFQNT
jgi:hypothetical protein